MKNTPMQRLLDLLADAESPPSIQVPKKFLDEINRVGEIRSREEFLNLERQRLERREP